MKHNVWLLAALTTLCACSTNLRENNSTKDSTTIFVMKKADTLPTILKDTTRIITDTITGRISADSIIPGKGIGQIALNEKRESVIAKLGRPDAGDAAMGKAISIWHSKRKGNDSTVHSVTVYSTTNFGDKEESHKVQSIRITSPVFITAQSIKCSSTLAFLKIQCPEIRNPQSFYKDSSTGEKINIYENVKTGIAFEINSAGKCIGISVHKPGKKITQTYLPMFPGLVSN
jgi:hypothetical protein